MVGLRLEEHLRRFKEVVELLMRRKGLQPQLTNSVREVAQKAVEGILKEFKEVAEEEKRTIADSLKAKLGDLTSTYMDEAGKERATFEENEEWMHQTVAPIMEEVDRVP